VTKAKGLVLKERTTETPLDLRRIAPEVVRTAGQETTEDEDSQVVHPPARIRAPRAGTKKARRIQAIHARTGMWARG